MVMLNNKTYAPSSYVGSPQFTRMEKTARTPFSDGEKDPTTKEVRLLLVRNMVFFELFLCYYYDFLCCPLLPHSFLSVSLYQKRQNTCY